MSNRSLSTSSFFASTLAVAAFCSVVASPSDAQATGKWVPSCGLKPLAPAAEPYRADEISIPANAPALAFALEADGGTLDEVTLKSNDGATIASSRETVGNEVVLRPSASLVAGSAYVVEQATTCTSGAQPLPAETLRFRARSAAALPKSMGALSVQDEPAVGVTQPKGWPTVVLAPSEDAKPWLTLTRFRIRVPGSSDPGIETSYGSRTTVSGTHVLAWVGAFCQSRPTKLEVSATIAGQSTPYATDTVDVDTSAYCDQVYPETASSEADAGGCSTTARSPSSHGAALVAIGALALTAIARRRRARA